MFNVEEDAHSFRDRPNDFNLSSSDEETEKSNIIN